MVLSFPRRILRGLGNALMILLALGALGNFLPGTPILGELGPILTAQLGLWTTILAGLGALLVFRRWRAGGRRRTAVLAAMAAFAALITTKEAKHRTDTWMNFIIKYSLFKRVNRSRFYLS